MRWKQINRKYEIRFVKNLQFYKPSVTATATDFHHETLLDGELIRDVVAQPGGDAPKEILKFVIFDALLISGKNIFIENLNIRLNVLEGSFYF